MKGVAGIPGDLWQLWSTTSTANENVPQAQYLTNQYPGHYKPAITNQWNLCQFEKVICVCFLSSFSVHSFFFLFLLILFLFCKQLFSGLVKDINQPSLPTPFYSVLVTISVYMALSTVFHSINSSTTLRFLTVLPVSFLPYWSFQLYISLWKSPSALTKSLVVDWAQNTINFVIC